jgi:hypothetical protein
MDRKAAPATETDREMVSSRSSTAYVNSITFSRLYEFLELPYSFARKHQGAAFFL